MKESPKAWSKWAYFSVMAGCAQFVVLTLLAMVAYPGGTHSDPTTKGYSFFRNFFSDLGLTETFLGQPKPASYLLFTIALTLAGIALIIFFSVFPKFFAQSKPGKWLGILGSIPGAISGMAYIGVAFTPGNLYGKQHELFVQIAFVAFFVAVLLYIIAILLNKNYPHSYAWVFVAFALILAVYIWLLFEGPSTSTPNGLVIQATGQKIVVYAAIISMFLQAYGAWKIERSA
jgi:hypothetical membrane protein